MHFPASLSPYFSCQGPSSHFPLDLCAFLFFTSFHFPAALSFSTYQASYLPSLMRVPTFISILESPLLSSLTSRTVLFPSFYSFTTLVPTLTLTLTYPMFPICPTFPTFGPFQPLHTVIFLPSYLPSFLHSLQPSFINVICVFIYFLHSFHPS